MKGKNKRGNQLNAFVITHWSYHLKLSHIPSQNIRLLYEFHWDEPKHPQL